MFQRFPSIEPGAKIPKPEAEEPFLASAWGLRRGEKALIYEIPNRKGGRPYKKGITETELSTVYDRLHKSGEFTSEWARTHLAACIAEGRCNFTTIGGIMELLGVARYSGPGRYQKI